MGWTTVLPAPDGIRADFVTRRAQRSPRSPARATDAPQALERLACAARAAVRLVGPADPREPLGVLEQDDRLLERHVDRSELRGGGGEQAVGLGRITREARTEPLRERGEIGRPQPDRGLFDDPQQPVRSLGSPRASAASSPLPVAPA